MYVTEIFVLHSPYFLLIDTKAINKFNFFLFLGKAPINSVTLKRTTEFRMGDIMWKEKRRKEVGIIRDKICSLPSSNEDAPQEPRGKSCTMCLV